MSKICIKAAGCFVALTIICGVLYTGAVTGLAQLLFPYQANGSIIEVDGKKYGCEMLGQYYDDNEHMWGRIMNIDVQTFQDENGKYLMYASPSNISPASEEYEEMVAQRVELITESHPDMAGTSIPVDLVTCSGSGLDPHISLAAAQYQVGRIASHTGLSEDAVNEIIDKCTTKRLLGVLGEPVVNVLKVNLMLDGILE